MGRGAPNGSEVVASAVSADLFASNAICAGTAHATAERFSVRR